MYIMFSDCSLFGVLGEPGGEPVAEDGGVPGPGVLPLLPRLGTGILQR